MLPAQVERGPALAAGKRAGVAEAGGGQDEVRRERCHDSEASPHLSRCWSAAGRSWHQSRVASPAKTSPSVDHRDGCRGFTGPFPPPLWMSNMKLSGPQKCLFLQVFGRCMRALHLVTKVNRSARKATRQVKTDVGAGPHE